jgi:cell division protease FtsH
MDGFDKDTGIIVMAATNRADMLDDALLRPGRFDRKIPISLPDVYEREQILNVHVKNKNIADEVSLRDVASQTPGFSGAQLSNLMNEAAIRMLRRNDTIINKQDVNSAIDREIMGLEKTTKLSLGTKERVAVHEAGHAVSAIFSENYDNISRVTIIPRTSGAGGFTAFVGNEDRMVGGLYTLDYLKTQLVVLLGGRVAEEFILGENTISTGASSDLQRVEKLARQMITEWGYGKSLTYGLTPGTTASDSIDFQVEELVEEAYASASSIISSNLHTVRLLVQKLLEKNTIDYSDIKEILESE